MASVYGCCRLCRPAGVLACWFVIGLAGAARPAPGHDVPAEMRAAATRFLQGADGRAAGTGLPRV